MVTSNHDVGGETQEAADDYATIEPDREPKIPQPAVPLTSALKVIARLNRDTTWVATGLLGSVVFAAVMVAVRDPHPKTDVVTRVSDQVKTELSPNPNPAANFNVERSAEKSAGVSTSARTTNDDSGFTSLSQNASPALQTNASPSAFAPRSHLLRDARPKIPNLRHRSVKRPGIVNPKLRVIVSWFRSIGRNERSRDRPPPSR